MAEAQGSSELSFEETGAYRLLLPAMVEDPEELQGFYDETVAPLLIYDEQYETELVQTLETFLDADGNVAQTAERLFTHRHTIRYRLERVRELTGLDVSSTDGRERLGLGLKAMRVLGILAPQRTRHGARRRGRPGAPRREGPLGPDPGSATSVAVIGYQFRDHLAEPSLLLRRRRRPGDPVCRGESPKGVARLFPREPVS